ncbi:MAG: TlpA family protein disulfide reductase [Ruminococcaceae bacterium]|nr:TlpA family protein disulfide reductase [Oscillospiraceae bacterium]
MKRCLAVLLVLCALLAAGCAQKEPAPAPVPTETFVVDTPVAPTTPPPAPEPSPAPAPEPSSAPAPEPSPAPAPAGWSPDVSFSTVDMDGNEWTDRCFAENKLTVVNLWAHWCGPCVGELPDLQRISDDYASKGVRIIGIGYPEDEADNISMLKELGVTYPCLRYTAEFDPYMETGYIPTTIFVNSDGKVLDEAVIGSQEYDEWAGIIDGYLNG